MPSPTKIADAAKPADTKAAKPADTKHPQPVKAAEAAATEVADSLSQESSQNINNMAERFLSNNGLPLRRKKKQRTPRLPSRPPPGERTIMPSKADLAKQGATQLSEAQADQPKHGATKFFEEMPFRRWGREQARKAKLLYSCLPDGL
jgi:hypothetical protein